MSLVLSAFGALLGVQMDVSEVGVWVSYQSAIACSESRWTFSGIETSVS